VRQMELKGKRIVMTGVSGFIGSHVARLLLEEGAEVYGLVRPLSANKSQVPVHERMHVLLGSLKEAGVCLKAVGRADGFLHFAWSGVNREEIDSPAVQKANVDASLECLRAARELGCEIFMDAGSRVEYGIMEDGIMEEKRECHPVNEYGKAKLEFYRQSKELCEVWGMTFYHLRFFSVYGKGDHPWSIISTLVRDLPQGKTVSLSACRHQWNFMEISDAAKAVVELYKHSDKRKGQIHIVNVASKDTRPLRSFVEEIHELCENRGCLEYGTFVQAREGALSICPAVQMLQELTDHIWAEQISFSQGIRKMLEQGL
jgi:nucleoside-diphosphate-sugar epimerase